METIVLTQTPLFIHITFTLFAGKATFVAIAALKADLTRAQFFFFH